MDDFVHSPNAQQGFSVTYDLRLLSIPSMNMLMRIADWGNNPYRQDKWVRLNKSCKVVVTAGIRFSMCKAVLKSFFYVCPPVCRTIIATELDQPEEECAVFDIDPNSLQPEHTECEAVGEEVPSEDGCSSSSCCNSADASDSTSASVCNGATNCPEADNDARRKALGNN